MYKEAAIIRFLEPTDLKRQQANSVEVVEGGHQKIYPNYCDGYMERGMTKEFAEKKFQPFLSERVAYHK